MRVLMLIAVYKDGCITTIFLMSKLDIDGSDFILWDSCICGDVFVLLKTNLVHILKCGYLSAGFIFLNYEIMCGCGEIFDKN